MSDSLFLKNKLENIEFQFAPIFEKDTQSPEGAHFYNYNVRKPFCYTERNFQFCLYIYSVI